MVTDCNAIKATAHKKDLVPRVARWWMYLQDIQFDIDCRKGKYVQHVDYLSRNPPLDAHVVGFVSEGSWLEVERCIAAVVGVLAVGVSRVPEWTSSISRVRLALNTTVQKSTGFGPLRLLMGVEADNISVQGLISSALPTQSQADVDVVKDRALAYSGLKRGASTQKEHFDRERGGSLFFFLIE